MQKTWGLALAVALAAALAANAQTPRGQGTPPTFQVDVDYVDVDVRVLDDQGRFVDDLVREDFELFEDGRPVAIDTFSLVEIPTARGPAAPVFGGREVTPDVRSNRAAPDGRFYVIVLDDVGTSALRSHYVIRAARQFVVDHVAPNDTVAIVYTSGRRDRAQEFTSDRQLLLASIDKFAGTKLRSSTLDKLDGLYQQQAIEEGLAAQAGGEPVDAAALRAANPFSRGEGYANRTYDINDAERGQRALGVLGQLKNYSDFLANVRGRRKAMVFFSEGIDYPVHDIFAAQDASTVVRALQDAVTAAARANVTIFTVDPRGLVGLTSEYIELRGSNANLFNVAARDPRFGMQPHTALLAEMRQTQDSLRTLAEETGGLAVVDANAFAPAFGRIVEANSRYYMLGYAPPNPGRDGRFRKIEVTVKRPGLRATARRGYAAPRANAARDAERRERIARTRGDDRTSSPLRALLDQPLQQSGLPIAVQAAPFRRNARTASVALAIELEGEPLPFANEGGTFANTIELSLFSIDAQGKPLQGLRTELDLTLRPETHARVKAHGLRMSPRIDLAPGRYQVRLGVREANGGAMGTVFYDLDVPDFTRAPLAVSGLLLTAPSAQETPTLQPDPAAAAELEGAATSRRRFAAADLLRIYAEIYDNAPRAGAHVEVTSRLIDVSGREVVVSTDRFTPSPASATDRSAAYSLVKEIPLRDISPGRYLLEIEARASGSGAEVRRETTLTVGP